MNIQSLLLAKIKQTLLNIGITATNMIQVTKSFKTSFGDYQIINVINIAKQLGLQPIQLAKKIVNNLNVKGIVHKIDIIDPGFINIFLDHHWLEEQILNVLHAPRLGISNVTPQTIVIDYSSPNVAKAMHVGHMRSTIIGDASVRILTFLGHRVIRVNHIGDWGTQFGMLIAYLKEVQQNDNIKLQFSDLENLYCIAKQHYNSNPIFAEKSRYYVVKLQEGDNYCRQLWHKLVETTINNNQKIYERMNITLTRNDVMGESLYNTMLPSLVNDLKLKGIAVKNNGAIVVFLDEFKNKNGKNMGVIIQKNDGGYLYTTTDIACIKYRYEKFKANRIIYYVDSRQTQHLMQVWSIVRKAKYIPESVSLEHHAFGMILDNHGKPFKTSLGGTVKLTDLLDEALQRAKDLINSKNNDMNASEVKKLAQIISIGAIKYADLSKKRTTDYVFNWNSMLSFTGNTAPYIQYAYTRIISLFKRSGYDEQNFETKIILNTMCETQLAVKLLQLEEIILIVAKKGMPHLLCNYLYDVATLFSIFYENCPILHVKNKNIYYSRLQLALLTSRILKQGLELLGIETAERM